MNQFLNPSEDLTIKQVETALKSWWDIRMKDASPHKRKLELAHYAHDKQQKMVKYEKKFDKSRTKTGGKHVQFECKYFKAGHCKKGDECDFLHGKTTQGTTKTFPAVEMTDTEELGHSSVEHDHEESTSQEGNVAQDSHTSMNLNHFLIDSGASSHFVFDKELMDDVKKINSLRVSGLNGISTINESGTVKFNVDLPFKAEDKKVANTIILKDVKLCKTARYNLLSVAQIAATGCAVIMTDKACYVIDSGVFKMTRQLMENTVLYGKRMDNVYMVKIDGKRPVNAPSDASFQYKRVRREHNGRSEDKNASQEARRELEMRRKERGQSLPNNHKASVGIPKISQPPASSPKANSAVSMKSEPGHHAE
jgi:hypothetical protein